MMLKSVGFGAVPPSFKRFVAKTEKTDSTHTGECYPYDSRMTEPSGVLFRERLSAFGAKIKEFWAMLMESIQGGPICPWDCPEHHPQGRSKLNLNFQA